MRLWISVVSIPRPAGFYTIDSCHSAHHKVAQCFLSTNGDDRLIHEQNEFIWLFEVLVEVRPSN